MHTPCRGDTLRDVTSTGAPTPPSAGAVFKTYLEYAQGLGWFASMVVGAAAIVFTLRGEIQVLTLEVGELKGQFQELKEVHADRRLDVVERDIRGLEEGLKEERVARRRLADRVNRRER
jgi:hypothetical protein